MKVYGANWTPTLLTEFEKMHGYQLQDKFPEFLAGDAEVVSDYREWHRLLTEERPMARMEVLCLYRHESYQQHLA